MGISFLVFGKSSNPKVDKVYLFLSHKPLIGFHYRSAVITST
jgi:hypothetical protein